MNQQLDPRELIPVDYALMDTDQLEQLRDNLWHSITKSQKGVVAMHHEYNQVKMVLNERKLVQGEREGEANHETSR